MLKNPEFASMLSVEAVDKKVKVTFRGRPIKLMIGTVTDASTLPAVLKSFRGAVADNRVSLLFQLRPADAKGAQAFAHWLCDALLAMEPCPLWSEAGMYPKPATRDNVLAAVGLPFVPSVQGETAGSIAEPWAAWDAMWASANPYPVKSKDGRSFIPNSQTGVLLTDTPLTGVSPADKPLTEDIARFGMGPDLFWYGGGADPGVIGGCIVQLSEVQLAPPRKTTGDPEKKEAAPVSKPLKQYANLKTLMVPIDVVRKGVRDEDAVKKGDSGGVVARYVPFGAGTWIEVPASRAKMPTLVTALPEGATALPVDAVGLRALLESGGVEHGSQTVKCDFPYRMSSTNTPVYFVLGSFEPQAGGDNRLRVPPTSKGESDKAGKNVDDESKNIAGTYIRVTDPEALASWPVVEALIKKMNAATQGIAPEEEEEYAKFVIKFPFKKMAIKYKNGQPLPAGVKPERVPVLSEKVKRPVEGATSDDIRSKTLTRVFWVSRPGEAWSIKPAEYKDIQAGLERVSLCVLSNYRPGTSHTTVFYTEVMFLMEPITDTKQFVERYGVSGGQTDAFGGLDVAVARFQASLKEFAQEEVAAGDEAASGGDGAFSHVDSAFAVDSTLPGGGPPISMVEASVAAPSVAGPMTVPVPDLRDDEDAAPPGPGQATKRQGSDAVDGSVKKKGRSG